MKPLVVHPAATAELEDAIAYHAARAENLGQDLRAEVARAFNRLRASPQI